MVRPRRRSTVRAERWPFLDGTSSPSQSHETPLLTSYARTRQAEAAIALAYPEPHNQGKFLGFWLTFRVGGQLIGGAVNLGLNAKSGEAGKVSYTVYIVFIVLQCLAPLAGLLLTSPKKVERTDGRAVKLDIQGSSVRELIATAKLFCSREVRNYSIFLMSTN